MADFNYNDETSIDTMLSDLERFNIITQNEINRIKALSVLPLPNVVKDRATELKERIANTVVNTDDGVVGVMNKRLEIICTLLDRIASSKNIKNLVNAEHQEDIEDNGLIFQNVNIEEALRVYNLTVVNSGYFNGDIKVLGKADINTFKDVKADTLQYKKDGQYVNVKDKIETIEQDVSQKQDRLVVGAGISIDASNRISVTALNLNAMPTVNTTNDRISLITNVNNEIQKITFNDMAKRIIQTADEIPNTLEIGQYLFLEKEEENVNVSDNN